ncbi:MAG: PHP domain-containing protein [Desulfuromonadales bacterium]|nr:PHP domain-containing protein [Desulfuromonadales bacterium]
MNCNYVDLHIHTTCSDGFFQPEEVVQQAARVGLLAIALADHDNIDGIERATVAAGPLGIEIIPAVELSSQWHNYTDMHLLGYGFDYRDPRLIAELNQFQSFRAQRNERIIAAVNRKLVGEGRPPIAVEEVRRLAGGSIGRPHIAQVLRGKGYVSGNEDAFTRYLIPCNVEKHYFPADEAIRLVHACGGIAVLAHPPYVTRDRRQLEYLVTELVELGLDGIEVYNNGSGLEDSDWLIRLAQQRGLVITGGSDFHGEPGSAIQIGYGLRGIRVPYDCVTQIKEALNRRAQPIRWA